MAASSASEVNHPLFRVQTAELTLAAAVLAERCLFGAAVLLTTRLLLSMTSGDHRRRLRERVEDVANQNQHSSVKPGIGRSKLHL